MAVNPWFKFYGGEYLSDPKIASLTPQERSCWVTLLCLSSISSTPGTVEFLTIETLLQKAGIVWNPYEPAEWDAAKGVLEKLARMKMISKDEDGFIHILNWSKRQETNLTDAERARSYRDRKRERHANVTGDVTNVTQEENRREEIREDKSKSADALTPAQEAKAFFDGGEVFEGVRGEFAERVPVALLDAELKKFINYWTERNASGTKARWQQERTFEVRRRFIGWLQRVKERAQTINRGRGLVE